MGTDFGLSLFDLDEEIEKEQEWAEEQEIGYRADAGVRNAAEGTSYTDGNGAEAGFFAEAVEGADFGVTGKATAEESKLLMDPDVEDFTRAPDQSSAHNKEAIADDGEYAEF